nr:hypothetical protein [Tanacetum cinerariifolium]
WCQERACAEARRDGARCPPRSTRRHLHGHINSPGFGHRTNPHRSTPRVDRQTGLRRSTSDRDASPAPIHFPPDNFKHSLTLFSKSFSSFPRAPRGATGSGHDGALTVSGAPFQGTWARSVAEDASPDYNSDVEAAGFLSWAVPGSLAVTKGILSLDTAVVVAGRAQSEGQTTTHVIRWDQGLLGMCAREKCKLKIPFKMGYGERASPPKIPG